MEVEKGRLAMGVWLLVFQLGTAYVCTGNTATESYTLKLQIKYHEDSYLFMWENGTVGIGIRDDDKVSVSFFDPVQRTLGVMQYKLTKDTLKGKWSMGGKLYTEDCKRSFGIATAIARR